MEALADNMSTFMLGVVVPLYTMAAVAIGCGDNRKTANKRKQLGKDKKHGSVSSKKNLFNKSKSGRVISSNKSLKKVKHASESKKIDESASSKIKNASKKQSNDQVLFLKGKKKEASDASSVGKASKPGSMKSVSGTTSGKSVSTEKSKPVKPPQSCKPLESSRRSVPVYTAEPLIPIRMKPHYLFYAASGGLQQVTLQSLNASAERQAVKVKCSDNGLYRVNPVYSFVEPGKSLSLSVYRNASAADSKIDKLVLIVATVSKEETDPMNAFKDGYVNYPKLVLPLLVASAPPAIPIPALNEASGLCV